MGDSINVSFKVAGSELSSYIDSIQKKSDKLTNDAIKGALAQNAAAKEYIKLIDDQIKATERKTRIEAQAARSLSLEKRENDLQRNKDTYEGRINDVFADKGLSDSQKKEKIVALEGSRTAGEQKVKDDYRENLTVVKEQERQAKIQTSLAKENIDVIKDTANKNIKAITSGDLKLADVIKSASTDEEKLVAKLTEEGIQKENKTKDKASGSGGIFGSLLAAENINKLLATAGQFTQTQNGFDLIQPASNVAGRVIGGVIGGLIGGLVSGGAAAVAGAGVGASIGGAFGDSVGALEQRAAMLKQDFQKSRNRYNAITGSSSDIESSMPSMENVGIDATTFYGMQGEFARRRGFSRGSEKTTQDAIYAEKGYGVDQGTSNQLVELQRSSREGNRDLANLIAGVIQKGQGNIFKNGDNSFLNEFLGKFATLQKELLKSQTFAPTGTTMDILSRFNRVGGEFDIRDPRGMGNINAIQSGLSNPSSDNMKAMAYRILSQQNPNKGIFDLTEEMSKGLGSPGYLKGVLGMIDQIGGGDQTKMMNLSGVFKGLSPSAIRRLFNNREGLMNGNISTDDLQAKFPTDFQGNAEANTSQIEKNTASINNGILLGTREAVSRMADAFSSAVKELLGNAVIEMKDGNTIRIMPAASQPIKQNVTKLPKSANDANTFGGIQLHKDDPGYSVQNRKNSLY